jgi:hypothetical protein
VTEQLLDVEDIFGFMLFHGCFPVSECVQVYFFEAWVLEFESDAFVCLVEVGF